MQISHHIDNYFYSVQQVCFWLPLYILVLTNKQQHCLKEGLSHASLVARNFLNYSPHTDGD